MFSLLETKVAEIIFQKTFGNVRILKYQNQKYQKYENSV